MKLLIQEETELLNDDIIGRPCDADDDVDDVDDHDHDRRDDECVRKLLRVGELEKAGTAERSTACVQFRIENDKNS